MNMTYEAPDMIEIGSSMSLTLGWTNLDIADGCDCTKCKPEEEVQ
jgi:hypothetical protein